MVGSKVVTNPEAAYERVQQLRLRIQDETWSDPHQQKAVLTGLIVAEAALEKLTHPLIEDIEKLLRPISEDPEHVDTYTRTNGLAGLPPEAASQLAGAVNKHLNPKWIRALAPVWVEERNAWRITMEHKIGDEWVPAQWILTNEIV
jgi:hypothetical protein